MAVDSIERDGMIELAARAMRFRDGNAGAYVVASLPGCVTPIRSIDGGYRLDVHLDDPLTFADRAKADKLAKHWNDNLRSDRQDTTVSVYVVEDFYTIFMDELDSSLLFEQEIA
jgi:hypothetical protein